MLTLFYPPFRADTDEELLEQAVVALRRYVLELRPFDRDTIERAWGEVVSNHKVERWPTIGVIAAECRYHDPQKRTAPLLPGERQGYDRQAFPPRARPDYSYPVEIGVMTQEESDRLMAFHSSGPKA